HHRRQRRRQDRRAVLTNWTHSGPVQRHGRARPGHPSFDCVARPPKDVDARGKRGHDVREDGSILSRAVVDYSFLMPAWAMMAANIGPSLATRSMWPLPSRAVTSNPASVSLCRMSGLLRISSATFSSRLTTSGGVFAGAISAV